MVEVVETKHTSLISQVVYLLTTLIVLVILLRFIFLLIGASGSTFVTWVYNLSGVFVQPFYGLFGRTFISGSPHLEIESIIAMIVVALIGGIIARLLRDLG